MTTFANSKQASGDSLMLAFAVGLRRGIRPSRLGWLGPMLFAVAAAACSSPRIPARSRR